MFRLSCGGVQNREGKSNATVIESTGSRRNDSYVEPTQETIQDLNQQVKRLQDQLRISHSREAQLRAELTKPANEWEQPHCLRSRASDPASSSLVVVAPRALETVSSHAVPPNLLLTEYDSQEILLSLAFF
jgi:hypothetical protein